jgi:hypothetical protein
MRLPVAGPTAVAAAELVVLALFVLAAAEA